MGIIKQDEYGIWWMIGEQDGERLRRIWKLNEIT